MKWIGQHIWDFISRFRNKVYFENLEGGNSTTALVVDSEGRVFTNTLSAGGNGEASLVRLEVRYSEAVVKGDPVYVSGFHGSNGPVIMSKADSDDVAKMPAFGLADADYDQNAEGYAISLGNLTDLNTSSHSVGDTLYVASGGGLTNTKPSTQAKLIQNVGTVSRSNANNGQVEVTATGRANDVPNLNDGHVFFGNANNQAVATRFSTLLPAQSLAAITVDGNDRPRMIVKGSALDDASGSSPTTPSASGSVHTILKGTGWLHTEDIGDRNNVNSLPLNIYTGHGQGTYFDSSGDATLNNSTNVSSGNLTLQSGDLKNIGSGNTTTGQVSIVSGNTVDSGSGIHTSGNILIRAGAAAGGGDCTAGNVTIEQGYASSFSGTTTHGTLKLGNAGATTPVEVLNKLKVKSNVIQDEDGVNCITFDSSGNTTIANTLNATLAGNADTATALTSGDKTIEGNLRLGGTGDTGNNWISIDAQSGNDSSGGGITFYETGTYDVDSPQYGAKIVYNEDADEFAIGTMHNNVFMRQIYFSRQLAKTYFNGDLQVRDSSPGINIVDTSATVSSGDLVGSINFSNEDDDGSTLSIRAVATEDHASGANGGTKLEIKTTPNGSSAEAVALTVGEDKSLTVEGTIELGNASDTTLARSAPGTVTIEGKEIITKNKVLNIHSYAYHYSSAAGHYIPMSGATTSDSTGLGVATFHLMQVMPYDGRVVRIAVFNQSATSRTDKFEMYINGNDSNLVTNQRGTDLSFTSARSGSGDCNADWTFSKEESIAIRRTPSSAVQGTTVTVVFEFDMTT